MGLYTNKHLKTFYIEDGIKKIDYARIKKIVIPNDNQLYCNFQKGAINRLLWVNYNQNVFNQYAYHCNYKIGHSSYTKHTHLDNSLNITQRTPSGIDVTQGTGETEVVICHLNIYNEEVDLITTKTITYEKE